MFAMYFVAFIDRVNVGFAKDAMAIDIALSQSAFALGAGIFCRLCAVRHPGQPADEPLGRKRWLQRHHCAVGGAVGALSACTGLVTNEQLFIVLRFLLGSPRPGFTPASCCSRRSIFPIRCAPRSLAFSCSACRRP